MLAKDESYFITALQGRRSELCILLKQWPTRINCFLLCQMYFVLLIACLEDGLVNMKVRRLGIHTAWDKGGSCNRGLEGGLFENLVD